MIAPQRRWLVIESEQDEDIHVWPSWEQVHVDSHRCRCCPVIDREDRETGRRVYRHHARDEAN